MPLKPTVWGRPSMLPSWLTVPSALMVNTPISPAPDSTLNRYFPSALIAMSRLVEPSGRVQTIVLAMGLNAPAELIENPATDDVAELSTNTHFALGVMAFQQLPLPKVGMLWVIAVSVPLTLIVYEEIEDVSVPLFG